MSETSPEERRFANAELSKFYDGAIEDHLWTLADAETADPLALGQCLIRTDEAAPAIIALIERAASDAPLSFEEETLLFRGLHILGGARYAGAFAPLLRLLALPEDRLEDLLGDATAETLPAIVAGMFDGDADALIAAIEDRGRDEHVRASLLGAATFLAWEGRIKLARLRRLVEAIDQGPLAEDGECVWLAWIEAIALLGFADLAPRVEQTLDRRLVANTMTVDDFHEDLAAALNAPGDPKRFRDAHLGYIDDVYATLERFHAEDDFDDGEAWEGDDDPAWDRPIEPIINPFRHVGRNDPCPCGSGKKAKKCCLSGAA
jgi:Protein of unknown function (DUF1186)/SEC-C motif